MTPYVPFALRAAVALAESINGKTPKPNSNSAGAVALKFRPKTRI